MQHTYTIHKPTDFLECIREILAWYQSCGAPNLIITLQGDLGVGKTTFTQELGKSLGVAEPITSPTFTIMKQYALEHPDFDQLVHIDAYRFEGEAEAVPLRLGEIFTAPHTLVCLEWPEKLPTIVPRTAVSVVITTGEGDSRSLKVTYPEIGLVG